MIYVIFQPGSFGSTIEYSLRRFSKELTTIEAEVTVTGSMHSFDKEFHPCSVDDFIKYRHIPRQVVTPTYPNHDKLTPVETIVEIKKYVEPGKKIILIHHNSIEQLERNHLFHYYKTDNYMDCLQDIACKWNPKYQSPDDMALYEMREALALLMIKPENYLASPTVAESDWLLLTSDDILFNFENVLPKIFEHCKLTFDTAESVRDFYQTWFAKQQYIIDEYAEITRAIDSMLNGTYETWKPLSIVGEAIIQARLLQHNIEIACYGLNKFPTDSQSLRNVLIRG